MSLGVYAVPFFMGMGFGAEKFHIIAITIVFNTLFMIDDATSGSYEVLFSAPLDLLFSAIVITIIIWVALFAAGWIVGKKLEDVF